MTWRIFRAPVAMTEYTTTDVLLVLLIAAIAVGLTVLLVSAKQKRETERLAELEGQLDSASRREATQETELEQAAIRHAQLAESVSELERAEKKTVAELRTSRNSLVIAQTKVTRLTRQMADAKIRTDSGEPRKGEGDEIDSRDAELEGYRERADEVDRQNAELSRQILEQEEELHQAERRVAEVTAELIASVEALATRDERLSEDGAPDSEGSETTARPTINAPWRVPPSTSEEPSSDDSEHADSNHSEMIARALRDLPILSEPDSLT